MNSRSLRRLAGDHAALHKNPLPPNYLFDPSVTSESDLTSLDILLAGPKATPYEYGVFKLHLTIPTTYPQEPPKAYFRSKIFHPNVDDKTGAVCVETLKRDWDVKLTLRDVLVTIACLLVQPNASSALNAEAGMFLEQGDWGQFEKRARMMTKYQSGVPRHLKEAVAEAQSRGEESGDVERKDSAMNLESARRTRRRGTPLPRDIMGTPVETGRDTARAGTPPPPVTRAPTTSRPFVHHSARDDVFGTIRLPAPNATPIIPDDSSELLPSDQKDNTSTSPVMAPIPRLSPRRQGPPPPPLGEVSMIESEAEYPPSPKKNAQKQTRDPSNLSIEYPPSPRKSPQKRADFAFPPLARPGPSRAESSRTGAARQLQFTAPRAAQHTPSILDSSSLLEPNVTFDLGTETEPDTEIEASFELPKRRSAVAANKRLATQQARTLRRKPKLQLPRQDLGLPASIPQLRSSRRPSPMATRSSTPQRPISPPSSSFHAAPSSTHTHHYHHYEEKETSPILQPSEKLQDKIRKVSPKQVKEKALEKKLWRLCGGDVERWNRGDFGGWFEVKGARW